MCLGIPGRIVAWIDRGTLMSVADIDFGGISKRCQMACVPEAEVGDYVLVHAGIALSIIDSEAADRLLKTLSELGQSDISESES